VLLAAGADPKAVDDEGHTPADDTGKRAPSMLREAVRQARAALERRAADDGAAAEQRHEEGE
jgi:hypothetical protein